MSDSNGSIKYDPAYQGIGPGPCVLDLTKDFEGLFPPPLVGATQAHLARLVETISRSGDPDEPFFYLFGPMTGIPQFNFPRFVEVADALRAAGYNIISPAELDDPDTEAAALASTDGAPGSGSANGESYEDFLSRDIIICSMPKCIGGIGIEGWHTSRGARGETWVLEYLKKELWEFYSNAYGDLRLTAFNRDERLAELGIEPWAAGAVPRDVPGLLTVEANSAVSG